jgi:hypothetical protein
MLQAGERQVTVEASAKESSHSVDNNQTIFFTETTTIPLAILRHWR